MMDASALKMVGAGVVLFVYVPLGHRATEFLKSKGGFVCAALRSTSSSCLLGDEPGEADKPAFI